MANHLKPGKKTPDVGSESGYISACLSMMVAPYGVVVGVEHVVTALKYPSNQAKSKMLQQAKLILFIFQAYKWRGLLRSFKKPLYILLYSVENVGNFEISF